MKSYTLEKSDTLADADGFSSLINVPPPPSILNVFKSLYYLTDRVLELRVNESEFVFTDDIIASPSSADEELYVVLRHSNVGITGSNRTPANGKYNFSLFSCGDRATFK